MARDHSPAGWLRRRGTAHFPSSPVIIFSALSTGTIYRSSQRAPKSVTASSKVRHNLLFVRCIPKLASLKRITMAKQQGIFKFTGTIQNVTGYEMNGRFYIKAKSEVPRRKIRYDACFANTRRAQRYFAQAQKLAKEVYTRHMQREDRYLKNWYRLRNRAQDLLRTDMPREEALKILMAEFVRVPLENEEPFREKISAACCGTPGRDPARKGIRAHRSGCRYPAPAFCPQPADEPGAAA